MKVRVDSANEVEVWMMVVVVMMMLLMVVVVVVRILVSLMAAVDCVSVPGDGGWKRRKIKREQYAANGLLCFLQLCWCTKKCSKMFCSIGNFGSCFPFFFSSLVQYLGCQSVVASGVDCFKSGLFLEVFFALYVLTSGGAFSMWSSVWGGSMVYILEQQRWVWWWWYDYIARRVNGREEVLTGGCCCWNSCSGGRVI